VQLLPLSIYYVTDNKIHKTVFNIHSTNFMEGTPLRELILLVQIINVNGSKCGRKYNDRNHKVLFILYTKLAVL
jgi:hypothetical protein